MTTPVLGLWMGGYLYGMNFRLFADKSRVAPIRFPAFDCCLITFDIAEACPNRSKRNLGMCLGLSTPIINLKLVNMKMSKYVQALLLFVIIIVNETAPFLYNEDYTVKDMKWGWIVGFPIVLLIGSSFLKQNEKE